MTQEKKNIHIQLNELKKLNASLKKIIGQLSENLSPVLSDESNLQGNLSVSGSGSFYIDNSGDINIGASGSSEPYISKEFSNELKSYKTLVSELEDLTNRKLSYLELNKKEE